MNHKYGVTLKSGAVVTLEINFNLTKEEFEQLAEDFVTVVKYRRTALTMRRSAGGKGASQTFKERI